MTLQSYRKSVSHQCPQTATKMQYHLIICNSLHRVAITATIPFPLLMCSPWSSCNNPHRAANLKLRHNHFHFHRANRSYNRVHHHSRIRRIWLRILLPLLGLLSYLVLELIRSLSKFVSSNPLDHLLRFQLKAPWHHQYLHWTHWASQIVIRIV